MLVSDREGMELSLKEPVPCKKGKSQIQSYGMFSRHQALPQLKLGEAERAENIFVSVDQSLRTEVTGTMYYNLKSPSTYESSVAFGNKIRKGTIQNNAEA